MKAQGNVFKYGDNIDTDIIIPARYLNTADSKELAAHCMEPVDEDFYKNAKAGDIMVGGLNFGCGSSREHAPIAIKECGISCVIAKSFARIFTAMPSISDWRLWNARRLPRKSRRETRSAWTSRRV